MKRISTTSPIIGIKLYGSPEEQLANLARDLMALLQKLRLDIAEALNLRIVSSDSQPAVLAGELILWHDTDAAGGQPTHYLVVQDDSGNTVTFASEQVV